MTDDTLRAQMKYPYGIFEDLWSGEGIFLLLLAFSFCIANEIQHFPAHPRCMMTDHEERARRLSSLAQRFSPLGG